MRVAEGVKSQLDFITAKNMYLCYEMYSHVAINEANNELKVNNIRRISHGGWGFIVSISTTPKTTPISIGVLLEQQWICLWVYIISCNSK